MDAQTIYFIDDDRQSLVTITSMADALGYKALPFNSGDEFLRKLPALEERQVFLDVRMKGTDGLETLKRIRQHWYAAPIVMISGSSDIPIAVKAMKFGATTFVEKPISLAEFEQVIKQTKMQKNSNAALPTKGNARSKLEKLTEREFEVSQLLIGGISNREVAEKLQISPRTVEVHRANMMKKMQVDSFAEFVKICLVAGMDEIDPKSAG